MKKITIVVFMLVTVFLLSDQIDISLAKIVAQNVYNERFDTNDDFIITEAYIEQETDSIYYYIFDINNSSYIIISAENYLYPVLGYCYNNPFSLSNRPPAFVNLLNSYKETIIEIRNNNETPENDIINEWNRLSVDNTNFEPNQPLDTVGPLINTIWGQDYPYNYYCPPDTWAGCVAVAMGQVMRYWECPKTHGYGNHSYIWDDTVLSADFENTIYDWNNMPNSIANQYASPQVFAIGTLLYHCGVSVLTDYGTGSSGASFGYVLPALETYFDYDKKAEMFLPYDMTEDEFYNVLQSEIVDYKRPVLLMSTHEAGHAFICDGYNDSELFHFNFGWGGVNDGWYPLFNGYYEDFHRGIKNLYRNELKTNFSCDITSGLTPLTVQFNDESETYYDNLPITSWEWDFNNDGQIDSYQQNPSYTFNPGLYNVKLTASTFDGSYGNSGIDSDTIIKDHLVYVYDNETSIYVDQNGSDLTGDGSENNPYRTIQKGIDNADYFGEDTIFVGPGTYTENLICFEKSINLISTAGAKNTIIDGNNSGSVIEFTNIVNSDNLMKGFTLINGTGNLNDEPYNWGIVEGFESGGGILILNSSVNLEKLLILDNQADFGGGILSHNSSINILNSTILSNEATENFPVCQVIYSGGIFCGGGSSIEMTNTILSDNTNFEVVFPDYYDENEVQINCSLIEDGLDVIETNANGTITNWGNNNINNKPSLYFDEDEIQYLLFENSPCIDAGDPSMLDSDGTRADIGCFSSTTDLKRIHANQWNWESFPRMETNPYDGPTLFSAIEPFPDGFDLYFINSDEVLSYNQFDLWQPANYPLKKQFGYKINTDLADVAILPLEGERLAADFSIYMDPSIQTEYWVGYWLPHTQNYEYALAGKLEFINKIQAEDWYLYKKQGQWYGYTTESNPGTFEYGKGYVIQIDSEAEPFDFRWTYFTTSEPYKKEQTTFFTYDEKPNYEAIDVEYIENGENIEEIGIFVDNKCVGASKVENYPVHIQAYTEEVNRNGLLSFQAYTGRGKKRFHLIETFNFEKNVYEDIPLYPKHKGFRQIRLTLETDHENSSNQSYQNIISHNYPNPFNPETTIAYQISKKAKVVIEIYNLKGQKIEYYQKYHEKAGNYEMIWNGKDENNKLINSGIYFYRLIVDNKVIETKKMILLK